MGLIALLSSFVFFIEVGHVTNVDDDEDDVRYSYRIIYNVYIIHQLGIVT